MRVIEALLCSSLVLLAAAAVGVADDTSAAGGPCAQDVARKVQAHYETVTDLTARFRQTRQAVVIGGGFAASAEPAREGSVVLAKPGRMRWSYETPDESLLVTDGKVVWMYDPLLEEAQRLPDAAGLLSGAAVRFLMGEGDLLASFAVSTPDCAARPVRLELVPREDAGYERLSLDVDPESGRVQASTVTDLFGNRTTVAFSQVRLNTKPAADVFRFEPPPGVAVIDLTVSPPTPGGTPERR
jgi:outer membrane lipoprotein carrier protein